jgi:hypothetical protein
MADNYKLNDSKDDKIYIDRSWYIKNIVDNFKTNHPTLYWGF